MPVESSSTLFNNDINVTASTSASFNHLKTTTFNYRTNKRSASGLRRLAYDCLTEASSASDTGGDITGVESYNTTSMDEDDFTDTGSPGSTLVAIKRRAIKRNSLKVSRNNNELMKRSLLVNGAKSFASGVGKRKKRFLDSKFG